MRSGFGTAVTFNAMARLTSVHALVAFTTAASAAAQSTVWTLNLLNTTSPDAVCLDGSPAGFYLRPGDDRWIIEMEGGGWCVSLSDCLSRSQTAIGSSKTWPQTGIPGMDGGPNGMLSSNCNVSAFCNWTGVHMNYCDGASFAGTVSAPVPVSGTSLYFRGRAILDATIDALLSAGMASAREVILKGCSAGGLATMLHLDYFAQRVHAVNASIRVVGMPDAGFFMDHDNVYGQPSYTPVYQGVAAMQNTTVPGSVNDACLAAHAATNDSWKCFMAQYTLPHIQTPLFMTQDLDDSWQMIEIFQLPCKANIPGSCNATYMAALEQYRLDMITALQPLLSSPTNGGFLSTCVQHCHQNIDVCYTQSLISNQSIQDTFLSWYNGGSLQRLVMDGPLYSDSTCYCSG